MAVVVAMVLAERLDCSRYGDDRYTQACEERAEAGLGVVVILALVVVLVGLWWVRRMSLKYRAMSPGSTTKPSKAEQEAAVHRLHEEYRAKLAAGDPDTLEVSRDWADNEAAPWRAQVGLALGLLVLIVVVPLLILFFAGVKALVGQ